MSDQDVRQQSQAPPVRALPSDLVRQLMWRVADRAELRKLARSACPAARTLLAGAKLLSAVEPVLRYQRRADVSRRESNQDVLCRLVDVWATGEAAASLGLAAARELDAPDEGCAPNNMLSRAARLWTSVRTPAVLEDATQLLGGAPLFEDDSGLLPTKLLRAQCEAAGPENQSLVRYELVKALADEASLAHLRGWIGEMKQIAAQQSDNGACTVGSAIDLWLWTVGHFQKLAASDPVDPPRNLGPLADALSWLLAARFQILDVRQLVSHGAGDAQLADQLPGTVQLLGDLCHAQSARAAGEVGRICAELVFGYTLHPTWDPTCDACLQAEEIDALEAMMPGISYGARLSGDVVESDGSHVAKAGPCVRLDHLQGFVNRRSKLDGCMSGARLARDRAAETLAQIELPDAAD